MQFGNAPCSWGVNYPTGNAVGWERYLDEVASAGYRCTELGPFGYLPTNPAAVLDALGRRGLTLVGATHVHTFGERASLPKLLADLRGIGAVLNALGARNLVIMDEDNWYPADRKGVLDASGWAGLVEAIRAAQGVIEGELGLKASFHPHVGTAVQFEAEIDRLLSETEIDLCFDTGHHAFWDQDPLAYLGKVRDRVAYLHLKNVDPVIRGRVLARQLTIAEAFAAGVMCPLPDGAVDIGQIVTFMEETGFDGPVIVEQDPADNAVESPLVLARRNLQFLRRAA